MQWYIIQQKYLKIKPFHLLATIVDDILWYLLKEVFFSPFLYLTYRLDCTNYWKFLYQDILNSVAMVPKYY